MSSPESITTWIREMQAGNKEATERLWHTCWQPVVSRARTILASRFRVVSDEEDIASTVLESVFLRAQAGDYFALNSTNSFWKLLWVVIERKVASHVEYHSAERRNVQKTVHFSDIQIGSTDQIHESAGAADTQISAFDSIVLAETLQNLFQQLSGSMRQTARLAFDGHTPKEIASHLQVKVWTIYSHLTHIRSLLEQSAYESH